MNSRNHTPFYIFFLNSDYVAAHSLNSLSSNYANEESDGVIDSSTLTVNTESSVSPEIFKKSFLNLSPEMNIT